MDAWFYRTKNFQYFEHEKSGPINDSNPKVKNRMWLSVTFYSKIFSCWGGRHCSVVLSAPTILRPRFESQAHHLRFFKLYSENNENKQKEAGIGPFFKIFSWRSVVHLSVFKMGHPPISFAYIIQINSNTFFKQVNMEKSPSSILWWDSNPRPSKQ